MPATRSTPLDKWGCCLVVENILHADLHLAGRPLAVIPFGEVVCCLAIA